VIRFEFLLLLLIAAFVVIAIFIRMGAIRTPNRRLDRLRDQIEENRLLDELMRDGKDDRRAPADGRPASRARRDEDG